MTRCFVILFLLVLHTITGCRATQGITASECQLYQAGNFIQNEYNNSGIGHWRKMSFLINRTDSTERVSDGASDGNIWRDTTYYKIKWLSPCSYERTYISGTNTWVDSLVKRGIVPDKQKCFIMEGNGKYYIQKVDKQKDTIWIQER